jgi:hypothetical protein
MRQGSSTAPFFSSGSFPILHADQAQKRRSNLLQYVTNSNPTCRFVIESGTLDSRSGTLSAHLAASSRWCQPACRIDSFQRH